VPLGRWRLPALAFVGAVVLFALALPVGVLGYWSTRSVAGEVEWGVVAGAAGNSLLAAAVAAVVAAAAAVPVALLGARHPGRVSALIERVSFAGHALPGIVVALALVFLGTRAWPALYQTLAMLVLAYVVLFLPQAIGATRAALLQIDPHVEEAARSLGRTPLAVLRTITAPLARSGVAGRRAARLPDRGQGAPATLLLAPIGFETLATEIWRTTSSSFFERGAVPSLVLLAVSAVPLALLTLRRQNDR
jgi:iron(III) transport system permease protein